MAAAARTLGEAWPGRFVLGIGTSHQGAASWHGRAYDRPLTDLPEYLDAMDAAPWFGPRPEPPVQRVLAVLAPRMLELAARRSRGVIPYLAPVEHTRLARATLGPGPVLAVAQSVVLGGTHEHGVSRAREFVGRYLDLPNYRNNLLRCGFSEDDLAGGGSDDLVRALVVWGDGPKIAAQIREHLEAGADHVCVEPLRDSRDVPLAPLLELAQTVLA
jgi:probable F420-dependent oxidoreductase